MSAGHVVDVWAGRDPLRIGFVLVGAFLGTGAATATLVLFAASSAPVEDGVRSVVTISLPAEVVWEAVEEPTLWTRWDALVGALEPPTNGAPSSVGTRHASTLLVGGQPVTAVHVLVERTDPAVVRWRIEVPGDSLLAGLTSSVRLEPVGNVTRVTYELRYELPSLRARALHLGFLRGLLQESVDESTAGLAQYLASTEGTGATMP